MAGVKGRSGRKPKLLTALLLEMPEAEADVEAAYRLFRDTMKDEGMPLETRLDAAREVLNRLAGKPMQAVEITGEDGGPVEQVIFYIPDNGRDAPPTDPPQSGTPGDIP